jgi:hypothetical protein
MATVMRWVLTSILLGGCHLAAALENVQGSEMDSNGELPAQRFLPFARHLPTGFESQRNQARMTQSMVSVAWVSPLRWRQLSARPNP